MGRLANIQLRVFQDFLKAKGQARLFYKKRMLTQHLGIFLR